MLMPVAMSPKTSVIVDCEELEPMDKAKAGAIGTTAYTGRRMGITAF